MGTQLPAEPELMSKFGVGRSTIREAIKFLSQSGFVKVQQGLGTFVISQNGNAALNDKIDRADFAEVFEVRQFLELKIIEMAAKNRLDKHLNAMRQSLKDRDFYAKNAAFNDCIKADIAFHTQIAESCGNSILAELYKTLSAHVEKSFYDVHEDLTPFLVSQEIHEELFKAIEDKNPEKALAAAAKIIGVL